MRNWRARFAAWLLRLAEDRRRGHMRKFAEGWQKQKTPRAAGRGNTGGARGASGERAGGLARTRDYLERFNGDVQP